MSDSTATSTSSDDTSSPLDPMIRKLISDAGLEVTEDQIDVLREISAPTKIELFEQIAKGTSEEDALLECIQTLLQLRSERRIAEEERRVEYERKVVDFEQFGAFLTKKMKIAEELTAAQGELSESEADTPPNKRKTEILSLIIPQGEKVAKMLEELQAKAKRILECDVERTLRRLTRRETEARASFELALEELKGLFREFMLIDN